MMNSRDRIRDPPDKTGSDGGHLRNGRVGGYRLKNNEDMMFLGMTGRFVVDRRESTARGI